jgi:hypothetical protein
VVWRLDVKAVGGENIWWLSPAVSHSESDGGGRLLWRVQKGKEFFVTFVTEVSGYSREAEPQIWEKILKFCLRDRRLQGNRLDSRLVGVAET